MKLWYHPESDSLFVGEEGPDTFGCEDMTFSLRARLAALAAGLDTKVLPPMPETTAEDHMIVKKPSTMASAIVASYKRWDRKPADLYPTPVDATHSIMELIRQLGIKRVWEPACGDGRLARVLEWHGLDVQASDLREDPGFGFGGLDFLNDDPVEKWGWDLKDLDAVITNPPFSLAIEFIKKALEYAPIVIMLVKQNYYNTKGRIPFFDEMRPTFFLPITWRLAFLKEERGNSPLMDCAWAVWTRDKDLYDVEGTPIEGCLFEPVRRLVYPGYHGKGIRASLANCGEALDELGAAFDGMRSRLVDARDAESLLAEVASDEDDDI